MSLALEQERPTPAAAVIPARERYASWVLIALTLLVLIGLHPLRPGSVVREELTGEGDTMRQLSYLLVFGFALYSLKVWRDPFRSLAMPGALLATFAWCLLSMVWAIDPAIGMRRLALTVVIALTVFTAVNAAGAERSIQVLRTLFLVILVGDYLAVALSPYAVHSGFDVENLFGNWRGLHAHKNGAGPICAVTLMFFFFAGRNVRPLLRWGAMLAAAYFLYRTESKTSLALALISILVGWFYARSSFQLRIGFMLLALLLIGGAAIFSDTLFQQLNELLQQPDALTGRVQIWPALLTYAEHHLLLGSGFGSFWGIGALSPINDFSRDWVALIGTGHNGYLDLLVSIGLPGLLLAVFATLLAPAWRLLTLRGASPHHVGLLVSMLLFCAGHNFTETSLLDRDVLVWFFLLIAMALIRNLKTAPSGTSGGDRDRNDDR